MTVHKELSIIGLAVILCVPLVAGCGSATLSSSLPPSTGPSTSSLATASTIPVPTTLTSTTFTSAATPTASTPTTSSTIVTTSTTPTPSITNLLVPVALSDMPAYQRYQGEDGGLYGEGMNVPPPSQYNAALTALAQVRPLDTSGNPSPTGKVVLISVGMSNTTMEFSVFKSLADTDPAKSPNLTIVDGAQGGQTAKIWATQPQPWQVLAQRLQAAGVTPAQVQVVWLKEADAQPIGTFPPKRSNSSASWPPLCST